ncbi:MAG: extracellular solute-binding protein [bacterium]|nr:extracellular solute-binding protein [bacterium]
MRGLIQPLVIGGAILIVGILAYSFLNLCGLPVLGNLLCRSQNVELTYWGLWEEADVMNPLIADFVEYYKTQDPQTQVSINYEKRTFGTLDQYKETLLTRLGQETGPGIFRLHNSWVGDFSSEISPLPADVLSEADYTLRFYPSALASAKIGTDLYAIPLEYDGLVVFYNKALFTGVNVAQKIRTWEDFRREAVRLTRWAGNDAEDGAITRPGAAIGGSGNVAHSPDILSLFLAQSGVNPLTELNTQAAADALTFYTNFSRVDRVWDATLPSSITAFANSQVPLILAPTWRALDILNLNPQLKFAAISLPQLPGAAEGGVHLASFWMEGVSADLNNKEAEVAWRFLEFMTREEEQRKFYSASSATRAFGEPYALRSLATELSTHEILGPLLTNAPFAVSAKTIDASGNTPYADAFRQAVAAVLARTQNAVEALGNAQSAITQLEQ